MSTSGEHQYDAQVAVLQEHFPKQPAAKLHRLLRRHNGDVDQVRAHLVQREFSDTKWDSLETRFGPALTALQQELPGAQSVKRVRLLKLMERFGGDLEQVRKVVEKLNARQNKTNDAPCGDRRQRREELKTKYAGQLAELASAGINVNNPCIFRQLEKHQGDVNQVLEKMKNRSERKGKHAEMQTKYAREIGELEADGVQVKNKRLLAKLFEKTNGDVNAVKQLLAERQEKNRQRKDYRHKHRDESALTTNAEGAGTAPNWRKRRELSVDDRENLKRLRAAGLHGNPRRILTAFHECNESIEMTVARCQEAREDRFREREERTRKRTLLAKAQDAYMQLDEEHPWPEDIEQVYLDGNNMMFVVDSLRRLCLNRAGQKTERAIGEIASAWQERLHIPRLELIFDSTRQLDPIGNITVSSAQTRYRTTDDMLVETARRPENREKNKRTVIVTSDRALAALLQTEGCQLLKPYNWFAHCVMILTPDLIRYEEITGMTTSASTPTTLKVRYNFDELVHRIANIDL